MTATRTCLQDLAGYRAVELPGKVVSVSGSRISSGDLPGLNGVGVDVTGWSEGEAGPSQRTWYQPGAALSLNYFPVPPDVSPAVGDDDALRSQFEESFGPEANMAVVDANWITGPYELALPQVILKAMMSERRITYIGSLIIPFAACSWVVKVQAVEGAVTGVREALWLDKYLAGGGNIDDLGFVKQDGPPAPGAPVAVRRMRSDDPEWDQLVPQHPLSKVRGWLPRFRDSLTLSRDTRSMQRFG